MDILIRKVGQGNPKTCRFTTGYRIVLGYLKTLCFGAICFIELVSEQLETHNLLTVFNGVLLPKTHFL